MKHTTPRRARSAVRNGKTRASRRGIATIIIVLAACGIMAAWFATRSGAPGGLWRLQVDPKLRCESRFPAVPGALAGSNVLLITLDTTRADYLGCYGGSVQTPALDELARRGVLFSQAITPAPITLPAHASLLTGLYPHHHAARTNGFYRLEDTHKTLARELKNAGYATGAIVSAMVLGSRYGLDEGFDSYHDDFSDATPVPQGYEAERRADRTTDRAVAWLRAHCGGAFFLWVHYFDPHMPYDPPPPYAQQYPQNPYAGEIAFMDAQLGRLLDALQQLGLGDNTLVIAAGDHGESLNEHGEAAHGYLLYNPTVHVPLIMACGQRLGGGVHVPGLVSLTDVMPTALALLGLPPPEADGVDLTRVKPTGPVYCESLYSLVEQGWAALFAVYVNQQKYIFSPNPQLFDLPADPPESRNLVATQPETAARMQQRVSDFFGEELSRPGAPAPMEELDDVEIAKLRSLGYVGTRAPDDFADRPRPDPTVLLPLLQRMQFAASGALGGHIPFQDAVNTLQDIIQNRPDFHPAYQYLADLLNDMGDLEQAAAIARRGLEIAPNNTALLLSLAQVESQRGNADEAADLFRRVLTAYPESFDAQTGLGLALLGGGDSGDALEVFTDLAEVAPSDPHVCDGLARAAIASQRMDEAVAVLTAAIKDQPTVVAPRLALAAIKRTQKLCWQAAKVLREGLALTPRQPQLTDALATTLLQTGTQSYDPGEAARLMERLCQRTQYKEPQFMLTLSAAYYHLGRAEEAISVAQTAQQLAAIAGYDALAQRIGRAVERYAQSGG